MSGRLFACALLSLASAGCAGVSTYSVDRVRDLSDVVDVRYGTGFGLGISVQFTETFQTGLGCSTEWYQRQWFGRKSVAIRDGIFASGLLIGFDGYFLRDLGSGDGQSKESASTGTSHIVILGSGGGSRSRTGEEAWFTEPAGNPPKLTAMRVGGAVFLPGVNGGLYLNLGELADFLCGIAGYDLMNDDGYPKFFTPAAVEP
jgi:hypothetical protein